MTPDGVLLQSMGGDVARTGPGGGLVEGVGGSLVQRGTLEKEV